MTDEKPTRILWPNGYAVGNPDTEVTYIGETPAMLKEQRDLARDVAAALADEALELTDLLEKVTTDYGNRCDAHDTCACSMARAVRFLQERDADEDREEAS